jgi:hypothetical protein
MNAASESKQTSLLGAESEALAAPFEADEDALGKRALRTRRHFEPV